MKNTAAIAAVLLPLLAVAVLPFFFRESSAGETAPGAEEDTVVIYTPHPENLRREVAAAFRRYYFARHGRGIFVDYRSPGGTSDIVRYIADRYQASFRREWENSGRRWSDAVAEAFRGDGDPRDPEAARAREMFLSGNTSIDADLFWGGGTYDHGKNKKAGYAVDGGVARIHPEFFAPESMPREISGEPVYDPEGCFYGVCLSSFGICCNRERLADAGIPAPVRWSDLAGPEYFGLIAAADPTKSGSVAKCYELIVQQAMAEKTASGGTPAEGWRDGLDIVRRIIANASLVSDSAGAAVNTIASGDAAAGIGIDFYAASAAERQVSEGADPAHLFYVTPYRGTTVSADPVQMLRGAPHEEQAREFIIFLLSEEGQKLYAFKSGVPGGPSGPALRRAPVRREIYSGEFRQYRSDPDYDPCSAAEGVVYNYQWTGRYFGLLRVMIRCLMLDIQPELQKAWREIIAAGGPGAVPMAMEAFSRLPFEYGEADEMLRRLSVGGDTAVADVAALRRRWTVEARENCRRAAELAREGK